MEEPSWARRESAVGGLASRLPATRRGGRFECHPPFQAATILKKLRPLFRNRLGGSLIRSGLYVSVEAPWGHHSARNSGAPGTMSAGCEHEKRVPAGNGNPLHASRTSTPRPGRHDRCTRSGGHLASLPARRPMSVSPRAPRPRQGLVTVPNRFRTRETPDQRGLPLTSWAHAAHVRAAAPAAYGNTHEPV